MKCEKCEFDKKPSQIYLVRIFAGVDEDGNSFSVTGSEAMCFCSNGHIFMDLPSRKQKFIFS